MDEDDLQDYTVEICFTVTIKAASAEDAENIGWGYGIVDPMASFVAEQPDRCNVVS